MAASGRLAPGRVVIIGADGLDAMLLARWLAAGHLPNLARLASQGGWAPLDTTNPAESPVAWASFATGLNPGQHGIYDFLQRDPRTYGLRVAPLTIRPRLDGRGLEAINHRQGATMWHLASERGVRCTLLRVPGTCPAEPIRGRMLAGLGVPDLLGSWGSSAAFVSTNADPNRQIWPLAHLGDDRYGGVIEGPLGQRLPFSVHVHQGRVTVHCAEHQIDLAQGQWSDWISLSFGLPPAPTWPGIARFYLQRCQPDDIHLYLSPLNIDPRQPCLPITYPPDYGRDLVARHGLFATVGWPQDASGLNEGRLDDGGFMQQVEEAFAHQARLTLDAIEDRQAQLVISVFQATDRVQHLFGAEDDEAGPVRMTYQRLDRFIGQVLDRLADDEALLVLSDHGFKAVRRLVNVNNWLRQRGWLVPLPEHEQRGHIPHHVDWSRTQAYALGLSKIYLNLRGREGQGCVLPGEPARRLAAEIRTELLALHDPDLDQPVLEQVYHADELYHGAQRFNSGDLILGFRSGYRTSQLSSLGRWTAGPVMGDNKRRWRADHCSVDPSLVPGVLVSNRALNWDAPSILDVAPTVLDWLRVPMPAEMDGQSLLR